MRGTGRRPLRPLHAHLAGWLLLAAVMFLQPWGLTAADTKHDLTADPAGFLAGALHAWTDTFTLGQLQNQAYGYLFPHGLFFLLADPLPDWIAQRLWWTLVTGVGYSGFLVLARRLQVGTPAFRVLAAGLFALSPRTLSTLTTISSETWPVMLAPWVMVPLLGRLSTRAVAAAVLPVAAMGAVNATATLAACLPAGIVLVWRMLRRDGRAVRATAGWLAGCLAVSLWWIGPLLVLGRYSAPFTDYIESSFVTTRWLNLPEILRGTTSWSPFVDTERVAGNLLVSEPVFVLVTAAVAALGLAGLALQDTPHRGLWTGMLLVGVAILGMAHGPFGQAWLDFLDGAGAPLRNLHKFDPLVRLPLLIGLAALGSHLPLPASRTQLAHPGRRHAAAVLVVCVAVAALAPAWSARLLPRGAYEQVPGYWHEATAFLNEHAAGTRTLIAPEASFARQDWGWTRDEPAQPLLEVPWAVRDAVPLIHPEAIRGLDGVMTALHSGNEAATRALSRLGIGAVLLRHDLAEGVGGEPIDATDLTDDPDRVHAFGGNGEIEIVLLDPDAGMTLTSTEPVRVAGGGEILALLDTLHGPATRQLVSGDAEIVTDTPMLVARNYGTLQDPVSAPLADRAEGSDVRNAVPDYPSVGPYTRVDERGGQVAASSSAADATSFGGADPARSVTAAVDDDPDTAWWPTPGTATGEWIELRGHFPDPVLEITVTGDTTVTVSSGPAGTASVERELVGGEPAEIVVPGGATDSVRVTLHGPAPVGVSEFGIQGVPVERVVKVPDTSPEVRQFLFQHLAVDTGVLNREFTAPRDMTVEVDTADGEPVTIDGVEHRPGDTVELAEGDHRLRTHARWVSLTVPGFTPGPAPVPTDADIAAAETDRLLVTGRAANPGLRAQIDGVRLEPVTVDAATQAFRVPAGVSGRVEFSFAGDAPYRAFLFGGGVLALLTVAGCVLLLLRGRDRREAWSPAVLSRGGSGAGLLTLGAVTLVLVAGWPGLLAGALMFLVRRYTVFPAPVLAGVLTGIAGAWLARAPWPSADYAGDAGFVSLVCAAALACLLPAPPGFPARRAASRGPRRRRTAHRAGSSTRT
ncbi:DUF3367 domain-containing protein [Corynebacterium halotolerans]|uniref:Alpha-(1->3)-arabinofuranosyltransferase N-terminal GT-C domain-containing protein n=1 Tax=Corynebacterium halotolerans YIM 70093 = DSM 44683 TaxID=1121362 RepID=M1N0Y8_9CORY|nr:hypothetical protein A605_12940 [Corynebacterium halotolerans YIM 70093 = DSM 44683]